MNNTKAPFHLSFFYACLKIIYLIMAQVLSCFFVIACVLIFIQPSLLAYVLLIIFISGLPIWYLGLLLCTSKEKFKNIHQIDKSITQKPSNLACIISLICIFISLAEIFIPITLEFSNLINKQTVLYSLQTIIKPVLGGIFGFHLSKKYWDKYFYQPYINQLLGSFEKKREEINTSQKSFTEKFHPRKFEE